MVDISQYEDELKRIHDKYSFAIDSPENRTALAYEIDRLALACANEGNDAYISVDADTGIGDKFGFYTFRVGR